MACDASSRAEGIEDVGEGEESAEVAVEADEDTSGRHSSQQQQQQSRKA